jgi:hypothetical protein
LLLAGSEGKLTLNFQCALPALKKQPLVLQWKMVAFFCAKCYGNLSKLAAGL